MGEMVQGQLGIVKELINAPDREKINLVKEQEEKVDRMTAAISDYAIEITSLQISQRDHIDAAQILQVVSDMERVSDQCENIAEYAEQMMSKGLHFSEDARYELKELLNICYIAYEHAVKAYFEGNENSRIKTIEKETEADQLEIQYRAKNIERLTQHRCEALSGIVYQDAIVSLERISDHARNIAEERQISDYIS